MTRARFVVSARHAEPSILPWRGANVIGLSGNYADDAWPNLKKDAAVAGARLRRSFDTNMIGNNSLKFVRDVYEVAGSCPAYGGLLPRRDGPIEYLQSLRKLAIAHDEVVVADLRFASKFRVGTFGQFADFMVAAIEPNRYFLLTPDGASVPFTFLAEGIRS